MNIAAGEDPQPERTASNPLKENTKECGKWHGKRYGECYSSNSWVLKKY